ncbi:MAG: response regulator [SAR202 cluster bacterium]|nr:response regulator [SAR202 cluster bacterium]
MLAHETNVLIVDDDIGIRFTLEGIIDDEGYKVRGTEDGYQAIELAKEITFQWVFMDIRMPGINGVETYLEIKKISPESKVVMMTGFSVEELVKQALDEGVYAVLYKPLPVEQVLEILRSGDLTAKLAS